MSKHRHRFRPSSICGDEITYRCSCGVSKSRPFTAAEKYLLKEYNKASAVETRQLHKIMHNFQQNVLQKNLRGYELICLVEKWQKKFPTVDIVRCDDRYLMSSMVVFIPHETSSEYWGTTMITVPQNGDPPSEMFFYKGHMEQLKSVVNKISRKKERSRDIFDKLR